MSAVEPVLLRLRLPCEPNAPRRAREALSELPGIGSTHEDVLLVASELATNAVLHSGSFPEDEFELWADRTPGGLRITVLDAGRSDTEPVRRTPDPSRPGGMGLAVVEQLAECWGSERDGSLRVWAEMRI